MDITPHARFARPISMHRRPALRLLHADAEEELTEAGIRIAPGALLTGARRLISGDLAHSIPFRDHHVAVQDEGSQLVAALVGKGERILDCCAAPGGKTAAIAARNPGAQITAVELHEHRARALKERVAAMNVKVVTGNVTAMEFAEKFDRVLADVPCSGTGTLAANPEIKWRLKAEDLGGLKDLQVSILRSAMAALAPGGRLVYSTCSLEAEEGEGVVEQVLRGEDATPGDSVRERAGGVERLGRTGVGGAERPGARSVSADAAGNSSLRRFFCGGAAEGELKAAKHLHL